jgi:prolyl-tRNA synthetase
MVLADTGEDQIVYCSHCDYAASLDKAEVMDSYDKIPAIPDNMKSLEEVETPDRKSVEEVTDFLSILPDQLVKTLIFRTNKDTVAVLVRGDHEINEAKLKNLLEIDRMEMADEHLVAETTGAPAGFAGPIGLKVRIISDYAIKGMRNFVTGGNRKDLHLRNVNIKRDFHVDTFGDLRFITSGDHCPRCGSEIRFEKGIEVGHIFKLGTKYSKAMGALFLDQNGVERPIIMGCYGIGVGRTVAAAIEQNNDQDGIIFPIPVAPFEAIILPLQMEEKEVVDAAEKIYKELLAKGIDVLMDDRDMRAGFKFKDADLLGIPLRIAIGTRNLKKGQVEVKLRAESDSVTASLRDCASMILDKIDKLYDSTK